MIDIKRKQPREVVDFDFDAVRRLSEGETIASASATYTGPDTALKIEQVTPVTDYVKVWISGGTDGARYKVTVDSTTSGGRTLEGEFILNVKDL